MGRAAPSASAFFVCPPRHCTSNCRRRPASRDARSTRRSSPTFSPRPPPCRTDVLPVLSAEEMRRLDRRAIDTLGIPGAALMENAGRGAVPHIIRLLPRGGRGARVVVVCGKGGNGGDGFVVARHLKQRGARVAVWLAARPGEITGDAAGKLAALRRAGLRPVVIADERALAESLGDADVVVDALLGTGTQGAPRGTTAAAITAINASQRSVVALDIPSGLPADGGPPPGPAVHADVTTTFAAFKRGLVTGPGLDWAGRVVVVDIGIPDAEVRRGITTFLLEASDVATHVPRRPHHAHKGTYGRLLIVAGSVGKTRPGELARMLGRSVSDVERDRIEMARTFATTYGVHLVLKGAGTVIADPDGHVSINPTGNPGMASGGTGDVLTGILGALFARGLEPRAAAQTGVYLHGLAGDLAAARVGEEALIASDVITALADAFASLRPRTG